MKKILKWLSIVIGTILIVAVSGFLIWTQITYQPTEELSLQLNGKYTATKDWYTFGDITTAKAGVILYPGAKVDALAYGEIGENLAKEDYFVVIPTMTLNLALVDSNAAEGIQKAYPDIQKWVIGGHSMGGVAAAMYADSHKKEIDGIFFLASYPADSSNLSADSRPILSVYGSNDGLATLPKIEASKKLLPSSASFVEIQGGNHGQFGVYGPQSGDNKATISPEQQQQEIATALVNWLDTKIVK